MKSFLDIVIDVMKDISILDFFQTLNQEIKEIQDEDFLHNS